MYTIWQPCSGTAFSFKNRAQIRLAADSGRTQSPRRMPGPDSAGFFHFSRLFGSCPDCHRKTDFGIELGVEFDP
jgi:hypothetical protein